MNHTFNTAHDIAHALATQHAGMLAGDAQPYTQAVHAEDASLGADMAGVLQGCRMLGFLEHDAQCVAQAWQAQTLRTGQFSVSDWPCTPQDFGVSPYPRAQAFPACPHQLGLYAVLPDAQWIARMARAGVPTLQLRFKSDDEAAIRREVRAAVQAVQGTEALLFINDHWQIAIDEGAYGVHLGQEDMDDAPIETLRAAGLRLGLSTHGYAEMLRADALSPSYLALGAVFPTTLKRMQTAPQGTGRLYAYAQLMQQTPLVAIGGIDEARIPVVMKSGVGAIAVVRAITGASDPEVAARTLQDLMQTKP
ncbi:thiamine-phosphate diphosphorylase [Limnohabitans sp. T6-5]|uniref:thiamine phosphate synthase n=1 Tax=Limnohabitans sp. T6-5 TaxID=1100724 RepID=UPI000DD1B0CB|nr:thiamine phosphate synthase [Limnohabitans sp. T6-5]PUE10886.1 thiamine-phosphate diphosphorylase [Limnohabitans sp. T6-5]